MLLAANPFLPLLAGWAWMVLAMMLPKLIIPILYIYERSLKRRRFQSALLFLMAYVGVWMVAGCVSLVFILIAGWFIPGSFLPAIAIGIVAVVWQFCPLKQRCLNRGHYHPVLAAFGWAASRDALLFGVMHGVWCVGSGWALMLFPMLLPAGHDAAMVVSAFIMISEHLELPRAPRWRLCFPARLMRSICFNARRLPVYYQQRPDKINVTVISDSV
jgi:predicted metal-binding membrane protein